MIWQKIYPNFLWGKFYRHKKTLKSIIQNIESFKGDFDLDKIYGIIEERLKKINVYFSVMIINNRRDTLIFRYYPDARNLNYRAPYLDNIRLPLAYAKYCEEAVESKKTVWRPERNKYVKDNFPEITEFAFSKDQKDDFFSIILPIVIRDESIGVIDFFSDGFHEGLVPLYDSFGRNLTQVLASTILYEENRRSEEKYRMLVDNAKDGVAIINPDGRISFANRSFYRIFGYSREELARIRFSELIHPDDKDLVMSRFQELLKGTDILDAYEFRIIDKSQKTVYLSYNGSSIQHGGKIAGVQSILRDITENKKFERQIKQAKDRYEQIIDTINDGLCVINRDYKITSCNRAFAKKVGLPIREILNNSCQKIISRYDNNLLARHCVHSGCSQVCAASNVFQNGETEMFLEKNQDKKGRWHYHHISIYPTKDRDGFIPQVVMIIRNITKQRETEEEIRRLNEFNQRILNTAPISILVLDKSGRVVAANDLAKKLMDHPERKLIGWNLFGSKQIKNNSKLLNYYEELLGQGKTFFYNDMAYVPAGINNEKRFLNIIAVPLFDINGRVEGAISMALDDTEAKNAKEKLKELNKVLEQKVIMRTRELDDINKKLSQAIKLKSKFIADASHELRTPLTVIQGNLDLFNKESAINNCEVPESFTMILGEVKRMASILSDLTILTNADSSSEQVMHEEVDLGRLIISAGQSLKILAYQKKIALIYKKGAKRVKIFGDETKLEKLLINIIHNAIKYSGTKGRIKIWVENDANNARIIIADNGIGIPQEELPYIFERFYRVDKARSREEGGTGLGLSICKWIVELHGGRIDVESEIGRGSTFRITLPYDYKNKPLVEGKY